MYARACLVQHIDRLVREEAVGDVAPGEFHAGLQRLFRIAYLVVLLVVGGDVAQDLERLLGRRGLDDDLLEPALERRFQKVVVEPTTPEQTLQILRNIAPHYEQHHKVRYTEEALQACVELTGRYITDRFFPDKAIDVLDEAGSRIHLQSAREPAELRQMESALDEVRRERREAVKELVYEKAASARLREIALRSNCLLYTSPSPRDTR